MALVTLGKALQNKDWDTWFDALSQMKKSMSWRIEDFIISEDDLLPYVLGEDIFEDIDNMKEARNRLHSVLDTLKQSSLLLSVDGRNRHIRMHDIIRDVTIWIAQENHGFVVKAERDLKEWPNMENLRNCKRLSLMQNEIGKLPEQVGCSQLMTLSLRDNQSLREIPDGCFKGMISLKVLDLPNTNIVSIRSSLSCLTELRLLRLSRYSSFSQEHASLDLSLLGSMKKLQILHVSGYDVRTLPQEIGGLTNLKSLHLSRNIDFYFSNSDPKLIISPKVLSRLSHLEELHLNHCNISTLPQEVGELKNLKSLDLSGNLGLIIPPKVLSRLSGLEELNLHDSFDGWEVEESEDSSKACLAEVASLAGLTKLELVVSNIECLNSTISRVENLTKFFIGCPYSATRERPEYECIEKVALEGNYASWVLFWETTIPKLSNWAEVLLRRTEQLLLNECSGPKNIYPELSGGDGLNNLRFLDIRDCKEDLEHILMAEEGGEPILAFNMLEEIDFQRIPNLRTIWHGPFLKGTLQNLRILFIHRCSKLKHIFEMSMAQGLPLPQLEEIRISECNDLEDIFMKNEGEDGEEGKVVVLPRLRILDLRSLPKFSTLCRGVSVHDFPIFERLYIERCTNLRRFPISVSPESTQRPRKIEVEETWFNQLEWDEPNDKQQHLREWAEDVFKRRKSKDCNQVQSALKLG
ncbi:putative disease resistance protein At1g63350 [Telopea speciosissima]|uniref:putative disease resistance protein At1g63350 n=1 Tax=Telopea speciosissima TaxID=54955 RepID=UPI001CC58F7D|nr:putative disease resistance protein At1g63350 [Telopea speciosissima]